MNILLAEDNPVNQEITVGLLETLDCAVTVVENGKEAVDAVTGNLFDLVLMDCQMPVMDGLDATRAIRETVTANERLPIIALTANDFDNVRADCLAAGMDDVLGKPFTHQEINDLLQRWRPTSARASTPEPEPAIAGETQTSTLDLKPIEILRSLDPDGGRSLVRRAIGKFVDYSEEQVTNLVHAVAAGDVAEVSRIAHSLKSSSANLGATALSRHCADLENLTGNGTLPDDIDRRLAELQATHQAAKADLLQLGDGE